MNGLPREGPADYPGLELRSLEPDEPAALRRTEMVKWSELVKRSGVQVD
ncbi:MAG: hypothetical protein JWQ33_2834 [Ramlibacter sp.]|nr:hypothetical protein [Ramlibacter sp.]